MSSPAHDIALELEAQSIGTFGADSGWSLAVASEPSLPETTITVFDTSSPSEYEDIELTQARFQVRVRSASYVDGYEKQREARDFLVNETRFVRSGWLYLSVDMQGQIESIGRDDDDRFVLVANYRLWREPDGILPVEE